MARTRKQVIYDIKKYARENDGKCLKFKNYNGCCPADDNGGEVLVKLSLDSRERVMVFFPSSNKSMDFESLPNDARYGIVETIKGTEYADSFAYLVESK